MQVVLKITKWYHFKNNCWNKWFINVSAIIVVSAPSMGKHICMLYYFHCADRVLCVNGSALFWLYILKERRWDPLPEVSTIRPQSTPLSKYHGSVLTSCSAGLSWGFMTDLSTRSDRTAWSLREDDREKGCWAILFFFFFSCQKLPFFPVCALVAPTSFMVTAVKTLSDYNAPQSESSY